MKKNSLAGKKILITAGPTWVAVDDVRVISNVSSGELGALLVEEAKNMGAHVDVFLGPVTHVRDFGRGVRIFRFKYFEELLGLVQEHLSKNKYDVILHCAAVSDYLMESILGKIPSDKEELVIKLRKAPKIVQIMRRLNPAAYLTMFKLEGVVTDAVLLKRAMEAMKKANADLVVANRFDRGQYKGFILGSKNILARSTTKSELSKYLFQILKEKIK